MGACQSAAVVDPEGFLRHRLRLNEAAARRVLALPPALRAPFDDFMSGAPAAAYASHVEGVQLVDAIALVWAGVRSAVQQRRAAALERKDPSAIEFDGETLFAPMEAAFERFREHATGEAATVLQGALKGARAETRWVRDFRFTADRALAPLGAAMDVLVRMVALLPFARFLASEHCERLLAGLRSVGRAPLALSCALVASASAQAAPAGLLAPLPTCSGRELAGMVAEARSAAAATRASATAVPRQVVAGDGGSGGGGGGGGWQAAAAARRAAWLAELQCVADTLPCMVTVADMLVPGACMVYANAPFLAGTGYGIEEVVGRNCRFLQGADTSPAAVARLRQAIAAGAPCHCALTNYRKDGSPFRNFFTLRPVWETVPAGPEAAAEAAAGGALVEAAAPAQPQRRLAFYLGVQFTADALEMQERPVKILELEAILLTLPSGGLMVEA
jgi:PAS domain-containing protein